MHRVGRRSCLTVLGAVVGAAWSGGVARAQAWPARPLTLIAPYPPGGGVDTVARLIGERLGQRLGQAVNVDNKPGAGATLGATALARSAADGYTLMLGSIVDYAIAAHVHKSLPFEMQRDLLPVVEIGFGTVALIVSADVPASNLSELIALLRSKPGQFNFASSGIGGLQHLNAEMFKQMASVDIVHVPYKGTAQFMPDLLSGRTPISIDSIPAHLPHIKAGKTRALAVGSATRTAALPNVPTFAEAGLPGYETATNYTLFVPVRTSAEIVATLNREVNAILQQADVIDRLAGMGIVVVGGRTEAAQARVSSEIDKWARVIKKGGLSLSS